MIGIGYNLMQCYTILILSPAMLSLITSYSLGKNPHNCNPTFCLSDDAKRSLEYSRHFPPTHPHTPTFGLLIKDVAVSNFNE